MITSESGTNASNWSSGKLEIRITSSRTAFTPGLFPLYVIIAGSHLSTAKLYQTPPDESLRKNRRHRRKNQQPSFYNLFTFSIIILIF